MDLSERPDNDNFRRHPWELARRDFFSEILRNDLGLRPQRVLDVGAGDAWLSRGLLRQCLRGASLACWDSNYSEEDMRRLSEGAAGLGGLSLHRDRPNGRFDLILMLDVLEHIGDDTGFLSQTAVDNLAPGGRIVISVPAWQALFSRHDRAVSHFRRYSPSTGNALLRRCGLKSLLAGGLFGSLVPPRMLQCVQERLWGLFAQPMRLADEADAHSLHWRFGDFAGRLFQGALAADATLCLAAARRGVTLPGLSWWAVCANPSS